jgi:hypothetical protein
MSARLPAASGPLSIWRMPTTVEVQSGQRSTSRITAQTRSGEAWMSTVMVKSAIAAGVSLSPDRTLAGRKKLSDVKLHLISNEIPTLSL